VGLLGLSRETDRAARLRAFTAAAVVGGAFLALLWGVESALSGGDPFAHLNALKAWKSASTVGEVLQAFAFAHPWQRVYLDAVLHHVIWAMLAVGAFWLRGPSRALALYVWASLAVMPLQLELVNVYRYGAVLFPALFVLGDALARLPRPARWAGALAWAWLNLEVTFRYAIDRWAY
jgi:hypothetical protein